MAGRWKGRRLTPPADERVRPTADRVREAWMSIVQNELLDAHVVDLFAGSGALGIEALSRGAQSADFVEVSPRSLAALKRNLATVDAGPLARVHCADALKFIAKLAPHAYDIAFVDPPYRLGLAQEVAGAWLATPFARTIGIEHEKGIELPGPGDRRQYGDTVVTFYRAP